MDLWGRDVEFWILDSGFWILDTPAEAGFGATELVNE
jgi:hypothetical protein